MDYEECDWLEEAEASDQVVWDQNSLDRLEREWEPSEAEDDAAVDEAVDPILPYIGDVQENAHDPDAPISTATLLEQLDEVSVERRTQVAQTQAEFDGLIKDLDRLDRNRERRERYHELSRSGDDVPLDYGASANELYFPDTLNDVLEKLIRKGDFIDAIFDCPYDIHELVTEEYLSKILRELSEDHKELLFLCAVKLFSSTRVATIRQQSDRNIRKVRNTVLKKIRKKLLAALKEKADTQPMTSLEKAFLEDNSEMVDSGEKK